MNLSFRQKKQQSILENKYSFSEMKEIIQEMLHDYTEMTPKESKYEVELQKNQEEHRRVVSNCIRNCASGNYGAKETVLELIDTFLKERLLPERKDIRYFIPFHEPERMTAWQQMEALLFFYERKKENVGFEKLCEIAGWNYNGCVVTNADFAKLYDKVNPLFTLEEERRILAQMLFAGTVGLGVIDSLNQQKGYIEEIQIGMSGKAEQQYDYRKTFLTEKKKDSFSRDGVHVMAKGSTIRLKALSFETEDELQRVLRNLIKGAGGGELTKNHPMMVVDTSDGRRISVSRPPLTDTWIGLIRKFDTVQEVSLKKLYQGYPEETILPEVIKQIIRSGRNVAITGEMASGKTTLFRACLAEVRQDKNIRVIEADSFELNIRSFLPNANTVTMRVTEQMPAEEVLAFARKTTGQIFAIGEINSASMAAMAMDLSKVASQLLFSAHYVTTEHMIADFVNAKLCVGGYSEEKLAELDVIRCLGFDIHLRVKAGRRYVQYINEIVPCMKKGATRRSTYEIREIYRYDEEKEQGILVNTPGEISYERAKQLLGKEEYMEFVRVFEQ